MSSLAASRADGFYNPPDWDPTKIGRDKYQRSKGKNQYEQKGVIRFELMYNCWCEGCKRPIGRGTRYNARKLKHGMYFTTIIYEFRMKCATCPQEFVIRTDPKNCDYEFVSGIKRIRSTPSAKAREAHELKSEATAKRLILDPIFRTEYVEDDKRRARSRLETLQDLKKVSDQNHKDDYSINRLLRAKNRARRKHVKKLREEGKAKGLSISLVDASPRDAAAAKKIHFKSRTVVMAGKKMLTAARDPYREQRKRRRLEIRSESIFAKKRTRTARGQPLGKISKGSRRANGLDRVRKLAARAKSRRLGIDRRQLRLVEPGQRTASRTWMPAVTTTTRTNQEATEQAARPRTAQPHDTPSPEHSTTKPNTTKPSTTTLAQTEPASNNTTNPTVAVESVINELPVASNKAKGAAGAMRGRSKSANTKAKLDFEALTKCGLQSYTKLPAYIRSEELLAKERRKKEEKLERKKRKEVARRERFAEAEKERKREEQRKIQEWWSEVHTINRVFHSKAQPSKRARRNQDRHGKQR